MVRQKSYGCNHQARQSAAGPRSAKPSVRWGGGTRVVTRPTNAVALARDATSPARSHTSRCSTRRRRHHRSWRWTPRHHERRASPGAHAQHRDAPREVRTHLGRRPVGHISRVRHLGATTDSVMYTLRSIKHAAGSDVRTPRHAASRHVRRYGLGRRVSSGRSARRVAPERTTDYASPRATATTRTSRACVASPTRPARPKCGTPR